VLLVCFLEMLWIYSVSTVLKALAREARRNAVHARGVIGGRGGGVRRKFVAVTSAIPAWSVFWFKIM
jgi:hypothetical protein